MTAEASSAVLDPRGVTVDTLMTTAAHVVRASAPLSEAAQLMIDAGVSGLPVVDADGKPVGVLSLYDVVRADGKVCASCAGDAPTVYFGSLTLTEKEDLRDLQEGDESLVHESMSTKVIACNRWKSLRDAARMLVDNGVHRLLVVDDEKLVGVISALDIASYVAGV